MDAQSKQCPNCNKTIKAEARICRFCRASFEVSITGYCSNCHKVAMVNVDEKCRECGSDIIDRQVASRYTGMKSPQPAQIQPFQQAITPAAAKTARTTSPVLSNSHTSPTQREEDMQHVRQWCDLQKGKPIKVNVISKCSDGESWDTVTSANGKLLALEEHPTQRGIYRMEFDSHVWNSNNDVIMLGFEVNAVIIKGNRLIINKGSTQRLELIAGRQPKETNFPQKVHTTTKKAKPTPTAKVAVPSVMKPDQGQTCPNCKSTLGERKGSPVSPYIHTYFCKCGWRGLRCGKATCDGYLKPEEAGYSASVRYNCVKCGWTAMGLRI